MNNRQIRPLVLACGLALLAPVAFAQQPSGGAGDNTTTADTGTHNDDHGYWGLLGLVGLAGLLGRKKNDTVVRRDTMQDSTSARRT